jgi:fatty acid desaturase
VAQVATTPAFEWDGAIRAQLQRLARPDNRTNWRYLAIVYGVIAASAGFAIGFDRWRAGAALSVLWDVPVFLAAVLAISGSQHQLGSAGHEATHYLLFRHRLLNELASDWLCMFPIFGTTYAFRQNHLPHHQFINDPARDPDYTQLSASGHWLEFPVRPRAFAGLLLRQLTFYPILRYILVRARFTGANGFPNDPYARSGREASPWPVRFLAGYGIVLFWALVWAAGRGTSGALVLIPVVVASLGLSALLAIPSSAYEVNRLRPVVSPRATMVGRVVHLTILMAATAWLQAYTGAPALFYFIVLWIVPLFTAFPFLLILRQLAHHGNADRGRFTNTRVFHVNPLVRYLLFPFGMDYHLPHHIFASVPHYRLEELHAALVAHCPAYRAQSTIVEGYFFPRSHRPERPPTAVEALGPTHTGRSGDVFIASDALDGTEILPSDA